MISFPHIAEAIFKSLDNKSLKNCHQVCTSWKIFLDNEEFFWRRLTKGHPGWDVLLESKKFQITSVLAKYFFLMAEVERKHIHPIYCAIQTDDVKMFKTLKILYPQFMSETMPFHYAADEGKIKIVELFIASDIEQNNPKDDNGFTPLHYACRNGHFDVVQILLKNIKGEKNPDNQVGRTPLHLACLKDHFKLSKSY